MLSYDQKSLKICGFPLGLCPFQFTVINLPKKMLIKSLLTRSCVTLEFM